MLAPWGSMNISISTRPTLNRRTESVRLYEHSPLKRSCKSRSDLGLRDGSQRTCACSQSPCFTDGLLAEILCLPEQEVGSGR